MPRSIDIEGGIRNYLLSVFKRSDPTGETSQIMSQLTISRTTVTEYLKHFICVDPGKGGHESVLTVEGPGDDISSTCDICDQTRDSCKIFDYAQTRKRSGR